MNPKDKKKIIIEPSKSLFRLDLKDLLHYRDLLFFLIWKDIKVRYKQTFLGAAWAVIQPFMTMVVFTIFFGKLGKIPSDGIPYPIFSFAALVPWTFFATGLGNTSNSLVGSAQLIQKVYFPRLILPVAAVFKGAIDFIIAFCVLLGMMFFYGLTPTANIIWLPLFLLLALVTSLSVGLWLSSLNVHFRDVRYTIPFITQIWLFMTPVVYPSSMLPDHWRALYALNPMVGVIEGFRWALFGTGNAPSAMILVSIFVTILLLFGGVVYFRKMEKTFADVI